MFQRMFWAVYKTAMGISGEVSMPISVAGGSEGEPVRRDQKKNQSKIPIDRIRSNFEHSEFARFEHIFEDLMSLPLILR